MDLRKLYYFTKLVQTESFSRAAKALHISQPSLSHAIKQLELELGASLIERTTKKFQLTDLGKRFYDEASQLLTNFSSMEKEMKEIAKGENLEIRIGMIESANYWFSKTVITYNELYPSNQLTLIDTLYNQTVRQALTTYNVHAAITNQHIEDANILSERLYTEPYVVLMKADHRFCEKDEIELEDLKEEKLIIGMPEFQTSAQIIEAFDKKQIEPNIQYRIERFEMIKVLVDEGLGIAILPKFYLMNHVPDGCTTRKIHGLYRDVYLCTMKHRIFPKSIEALFHLVREFGIRAGQKNR